MSNKTYYTKDHEWLKVEGNVGYVGITNFAQNELGDIIFVEFPDVDDEFNKGDVFGTIEAVKTVADLYIPVDSKIIEINNNIEDNPELVNENPEEEGWLVKIELKNINDTEDLLSKEEYNKITN